MKQFRNFLTLTVSYVKASKRLIISAKINSTSWNGVNIIVIDNDLATVLLSEPPSHRVLLISKTYCVKPIELAPVYSPIYAVYAY